jgi:excisionase family DNA binding protein
MSQTATKDSTSRRGLARIDEACAFLAMSRAAVYTLMDKNELKYVKLGKSRRIPWSELEALVERSTVGN